jgi:flagellar biosynthesis/type III secretory pathway M-ring protein FliF/YscJ
MSRLSGNQFVQLYRGLPVETRWLICGLCGAIVVALAYVWARPAESVACYLLGGQEFSEAQLGQVARAFQAEGFAGFEIDGARVRVPRAQVAQYAAALVKHDALPRSFYSNFDRAVRETNWWTSQAQADRNWELARDRFLGQIIEQMPEIETAQVLIDRGASRSLRSPAEARASVTVKPRPHLKLTMLRVRQIRTLVAGAVANLELERVSVVDVHGRTLAGLGATSSEAEEPFERVKEIEAYYTQKIGRVLSYVPDVLVTVSVTLQAKTPAAAAPGPALAETAPAAEAVGSAELSATARANAGLDIDPEPVRPAPPRPVPPPPAPAPTPLELKSIAVSVAVPEDAIHAITAGLAAVAAAAQVPHWSARVQQQVAHAIPEGVAAQVNVSSYPRMTKPAVARPAVAIFSAPWVGPALLSAAAVLAILVAAIARRWTRSPAARTVPGQLSGERVSRLSRPAVRAVPLDLVGDEAVSAQRVVGVHGSHDAPREPKAKPPTAARLGAPAVHRFEDLRRLPSARFHRLVQQIDGRLWATALRGASPDLRDHVVTHMPASSARLLREQMEYYGPIRLGDVEAAQHDILQCANAPDDTYESAWNREAHHV